MRRLIAAMVGLLIALCAGAAAHARADAPSPRPGHTTVDAIKPGGWSPHVRSARHFARGRAGNVRFAVVDQLGRTHQFNGARTAPMASLFKACCSRPT